MFKIQRLSFHCVEEWTIQGPGYDQSANLISIPFLSHSEITFIFHPSSSFILHPLISILLLLEPDLDCILSILNLSLNLNHTVSSKYIFLHISSLFCHGSDCPPRLFFTLCCSDCSVAAHLTIADSDQVTS